MEGKIIDLFADEPAVKRTSKPVKAKGWSGLKSSLLPLLMVPKKILLFISIFFFMGFFQVAYFILKKIIQYLDYSFIVFLPLIIYEVFKRRKNILEWIKNKLPKKTK